jgi:hypothetical protein
MLLAAPGLAAAPTRNSYAPNPAIPEPDAVDLSQPFVDLVPTGDIC